MNKMENAGKNYPDMLEDELLFSSPTISEKKYAEAIEMLQAINAKERTNEGPNAAERAHQTLLRWLLEDGEKPP